MHPVEEVRFLRSPLVLKELLAFLGKGEREGFEKILKSTLERERFHSSSLPLSQLEGFWEILFSRYQEKFCFLTRLLSFLAAKYFRWSPRLGLPILREENILHFQRLLGWIWTDHLWLFALVYGCEDYGEDPRPRNYIPSNWWNFLLPPVDEPVLLSLREKGLVEVHRHLSGSLPPLVLWHSFLRFYRKFVRTCFHVKDSKDWENLLPPEITLEEFRFWCLLLPPLRQALQTGEGFGEIRRALATQDMFRLYPLCDESLSSLTERGDDERCFLLQSYRKLCDPEVQSDYEWWLYAYLLLQNNWLRIVVLPQKGLGFERFEKLVHSPTRDILEEFSERNWDKFLEIESRNGVKALEVRIRPYEDFKKFHRKLRTITKLKQHGTNLELNHYDTNLGIILHFIKEKDDIDLEKTAIISVRHAQLRRRLWKEAYNILRFKFSEKGSLIVGLDAANNETYATPEVFSSVIRFLRKAIYENYSPFQECVIPLNLTFHAGESFRHLLSGIRYIDECVEFLEMRAGDRIGHALALGIEPEDWSKKVKGTVFLPRGEWLDNLVWFIHQLRKLNGFEDLIINLEEQAFRLLHEIYGNKVDLESYFRMWKHFRKEEALFLEFSNYPVFEPVIWLENTRKSLPECDFKLWERYHLDPEVRYKSENFIKVKVDEKFNEAIRAIQNLILQKVIDYEIIIEVNPSSNLAVGGFDLLSEHPIFRWFPPQPDSRNFHPWIVIGSDDPGIFQTQLWHEYIFLAFAARYHGTSPFHISKWLETLAENSRKFSFFTETSSNDDLTHD